MNGYVMSEALKSKKEKLMTRLEKDGFAGITVKLCDPSAVGFGGRVSNPSGYRSFHVLRDQSLREESIEIDYSDKDYNDLVSKLHSHK